MYLLDHDVFMTQSEYYVTLIQLTVLALLVLFNVLLCSLV